MSWQMAADDGYDGIQYDTFHGSSPAHLEAEEIRRECYGLDSDDSEEQRS